MDFGSLLFGGLGSSTDPSQYKTANPEQAQIDALMRQRTAQLDPNAQNQFRAQQLAQAMQLQRIASGQAQGAGELAAQRSVQNALAGQQAMARMARGGNAGLAMRNAATNAANIGLSGAGQAQEAALRDQQMAQSQLTNALGQGRGQDINFAGQNASLAGQRYGQDLNMLNSLNSQGLNAEMQRMQATNSQQGILGGLLNAGGTMLASYLGAPKASGGNNNAYTAPGEIGAGYSDDAYAASPAVPSDRRLKTDINEDAGDDVDEMLDKLQATSFRYKDEERHGKGERLGVMAQDLARSRLGRAVVRKERDGLMLDPGKAVSAALAASARLNERVRKLEERAP